MIRTRLRGLINALRNTLRPALGDGLADEVDYLLGGRAGREDLGHAELLQLRDVVVRDGAAYRHDHVLGALLLEQFADPRDERHVRARKAREADGVGVLL